jgi:hypothetical protein
MQKPYNLERKHIKEADQTQKKETRNLMQKGARIDDPHNKAKGVGNQKKVKNLWA